MSVLAVELILAVEFILRLALNVVVLLVILQIIFVRIIFVLNVFIVQLHVLLFIVYLQNIVGVNVASAAHIRVHVYILISFASVYRLPVNGNIVNRVVIAHVNVVPINFAVKLAIVSGRGVRVHAHNQNHILSGIFSIK
jgi:hypothetical protein